MDGPDQDHMLVHEAQDRLGVGESLVRKLFDAGELDGYRLPGRGDRRITRESVERMYQQMRRQRVQDGEGAGVRAPDRQHGDPGERDRD